MSVDVFVTDDSALTTVLSHVACGRARVAGYAEFARWVRHLE